MFGMVLTLVAAVVILAALFGGLVTMAGETEKGGAVLSGCMTAFFLYMLVIGLFGMNMTESGVFSTGLPLLNHIDEYGSVRELLSDRPFQFALDFVELVTLLVLIHWVSNFLSSGGAGFAGMILTKIIIVLVGCLLYGLFMEFVGDNIVMKWAVYCVECIITGSAIIYTPALLISTITGLREGNLIVSYLISQFPGTSLGKAITSAITTAVVLIAIIMALETQYGSISNIFSGLVDSLEGIGTIIVALMGVYFMVSALKK